MGDIAFFMYEIEDWIDRCFPETAVRVVFLMHKIERLLWPLL